MTKEKTQNVVVDINQVVETYCYAVISKHMHATSLQAMEEYSSMTNAGKVARQHKKLTIEYAVKHCKATTVSGVTQWINKTIVPPAKVAYDSAYDAKELQNEKNGTTYAVSRLANFKARFKKAICDALGVQSDKEIELAEKAHKLLATIGVTTKTSEEDREKLIEVMRVAIVSLQEKPEKKEE